jgi:HK97 family phage prohead protease
MIRMVMPAQVSALGEDQVEVVISTSEIARDGHILVPTGARLQNYRRNPIWLWAHDPREPIGRSTEIMIEADKIRSLVQFAPLGISAQADKIRGLVKSEIVRAISVGFDPIEMAPLDATKPRRGQRITEWDLLECSFCAVGIDTGALVTSRALTDAIAEHRAEADPLPLEFRRRQAEMLALSPACEPDSVSFSKRQRELEVIDLAAAPLREHELAELRHRRQAEAARLAR